MKLGQAIPLRERKAIPFRERKAIDGCRALILAAHPDADPAPLILGLLCFYLAQQRNLIVPSLPKTHFHIGSALDELRDRGLPVPQSWLAAMLPLSDPLIVKLLDRLASLSNPPVELLGQVYEGLQSRFQKRSGGIFYTPIAIADYVVDQTIATPMPRILDPACGGGIFLLRAYQKLIDRLEHPSFEQRMYLLQKCIYGVDIDPQAVAIAQVALLLKSVEGLSELPPNLDSGRSLFPHLNQNLQCGNAVIQPDAEVLQSDQFDVVIGNPPYLDAEQMTLLHPDWRQYCTQHYRSARGNWDLFCVFIERAIDLCRAGGFTSLVVPNKLISANYAAQARSLLAKENQLLSLRDYSHLSLFAASVYPIVYVVRKQAPIRSTLVRYEVMGAQVQETRWLSYSHFLSDRLPWLLTTSAQPQDLLRLQQLPTLASIAQVSGAATVAEAYALQPFIVEAEDCPNAPRFVNSGTIDRYSLLWGEKLLRYLGATFDRPVVRLPVDPLLHKRLQQVRQPKLIVAGMTRQIECAADLEGVIWPGKSTCVIRAIALDDLRYLLALLNSKVVNCYFTNLFQGNRLQGGYLRIGPPQLRQIPLPALSNRSACQRRDRLIALTQQRLETLKSQRDRLVTLDTQIENLVCELYQLDDGAIERMPSI